jgi:hypothetical protein
MKKQKICPICSNVLKKGEASFAFPRLPILYTYRKFAGIVHVNCLIESSEAEDIRKELTEVLKHSPSPIIQQEGKILIQNHNKDKCFVVYDFEDFAIFPIPHNLINKILNTYHEKQLNLDVNGFLKLLINDSFKLNLFKPFQEETIILSSLPLKRLKKMFRRFLAKQKAELFIEQRLQNSASSSYICNQNMALPNFLVPLKPINDPLFKNILAVKNPVKVQSSAPKNLQQENIQYANFKIG